MPTIMKKENAADSFVLSLSCGARPASNSKSHSAVKQSSPGDKEVLPYIQMPTIIKKANAADSFVLSLSYGARLASNSKPHSTIKKIESWRQKRWQWCPRA